MKPVDEIFIGAFRAHKQAGTLFHHDSAKAHELFQISLISAVLEGVYDGDITYGELAAHGDFGVGTFNNLDGEMVAVDGKFYQIKSDGKVSPVDPSMKTPFACVLFFDPTVEFTLDEETDFKVFEEALDRAVPTKNLFYALRVDGHFDHVKVRVVPRQEKPYRPMIEVVKDQPLYEFHDVRGTLLGFRFPDYTQGINVPGYHLHFIDENRETGGHVLDLRMKGVTVRVDITPDLHMEVPERDDFGSADLGKDNTESIRKAEK